MFGKNAPATKTHLMDNVEPTVTRSGQNIQKKHIFGCEELLAGFMAKISCLKCMYISILYTQRIGCNPVLLTVKTQSVGCSEGPLKESSLNQYKAD